MGGVRTQEDFSLTLLLLSSLITHTPLFNSDLNPFRSAPHSYPPHLPSPHRRAPELEGGDKDGETDVNAKTTPSAGGADIKVEEDDVKLVVAQTGCTEEKAREALKAENGDLINASEWGSWAVAPSRAASRRPKGRGGRLKSGVTLTCSHANWHIIGYP